MDQRPLTPHETMELFELIQFKTACASKAQTMEGLVTDPDLKNLLKKDITQSSKAMDDLQRLLGKAPQYQ